MAVTDTTLAAGQTAAALIASLTAALSTTLEGGYLIQIDEEFELVERRGMQKSPQVKRGMFGTAQVAHDAAATVTVVRPAVISDAPVDPPAATAEGTAYIPPSIPVIPATPAAQDVTDALVTLGLVTQAS